MPFRVRFPGRGCRDKTFRVKGTRTRRSTPGTATVDPMKSITVYCSASSSLDEAYYETAEVVGRTLAERGIEMVYGGGGVGLMGAAARSCKAAGGTVTGVITEHLMTMEQGWTGCDELLVVGTMRERKHLMMERAEGFLVLPGGIGTYEEFFEVLVARLLEEHPHPIGILNDRNYFDPLISILEHGIEHRFIARPTLGLMQIGVDPVALIDALIASADADGSGFIDLAEFKGMM